MTSRAALALPTSADVLESLRAIAELGAAVGGECALAAAIISEKLSSLPSERLSRRDAALSDLAWVCRQDADADDPGYRATGREVLRRLKAYERGAWRVDRGYGRPTSAASDEARALFAAMTEGNGRVPGLSTIRDALSQANQVANFSPVAAGHRNRRRSQAAKRDRFMKHEDAGSFLQQIRESPTGQKILEAGRSKITAERQRLADDLRTLDVEAEKNGEDHYGKAGQARQAAALKRVRDAETELREAQHAYAQLMNGYGYKSADLSRRRILIEDKLTEGEHIAKIREFVSWCLDELGGKSKNYTVVARVQSDIMGSTQTVLQATNTPSLNARNAALRNAIDRANEMKLDVDIYAVEGRLAALRVGLPDVTTQHFEPPLVFRQRAEFLREEKRK